MASGAVVYSWSSSGVSLKTWRKMQLSKRRTTPLVQLKLFGALFENVEQNRGGQKLTTDTVSKLNANPSRPYIAIELVVQ
jgi:hypothetical protein